MTYEMKREMGLDGIGMDSPLREHQGSWRKGRSCKEGVPSMAAACLTRINASPHHQRIRVVAPACVFT